jgi:hypothetical protein
MANQNGSSGMVTDMQSSLNLFQLFTRSAALPVEVLVRQWGTFGERYIGLMVLTGPCWVMLFGAFYGPHPQLYWLLYFLYTMVGLLVVHRVAGIIRRWRGYHCHSVYIGDSWFQRCRGFEEPHRARMLEVLVMGAIALVLFGIAKPLGALLLIGVGSHVFNLMMIELSDAAKIRAMRDAQIENEHLRTRYQGSSC